MKKRIENIKKQAGEEGKRLGFVILGFATGIGIAKGMAWLGEKFPQVAPAIKYGTPFFLAGGGFLLSAVTEKEEYHLKHLGYGISTSGVFEGVKLIPVAKEFLDNLQGNLGRTYYMENDKPILELGEFGINSLPMKSIEMQEAPQMKIDLPELENVSGSGIGYNSSSTEDTDRVSGII
jgi:hypothetical protein